MAKIVSRKKKEAFQDKSNIQIIQLIVCLVILGGVMIAKVLAPESVESFLMKYVKSGVDSAEVLETIGVEVQSFFKLAPAPSPMGEESEDISEDTEKKDEKNSDGLEIDEDAAGETEKKEEVNNNDEAIETKIAQYSDAVSLTSSSAIGGMPVQLPAIVIDESFLPIDYDDEIDDTLPLPFGMEKPEKVDYSVYTLPFEIQNPIRDAMKSSGFGYRDHPVDGEYTFHYGVDFAAPKGTLITAFADGEVVLTGDSDSFGLYVILQHIEEYATLYAHCSKLLVEEGEMVRMGDEIAEVGNTGKVTGHHLHFEFRKANLVLNPSYYLAV